MFRKFKEGMIDNAIDGIKKQLGLSEDYPNTICERLQQMGVIARVIDPKGPEGIARTPDLNITLPMFCVAIDGRNVQAIDIVPFSIGGSGGRSPNHHAKYGMYYRYLIRAQLGEREKGMRIWESSALSQTQLKVAQSKPIEGDNQRDVKWEGGILSDLLNMDLELMNDMITKNLMRFWIGANIKDQFIYITTFPFGRAVTVTTSSIDGTAANLDPSFQECTDLNAFPIADRICQHIRTQVPG
jgi:hypothetical protein